MDDDLINELLENAPEDWDGDDAAEAILLRYVRALEGLAMASHGQLPVPEDGWDSMAPQGRAPARTVVDPASPLGLGVLRHTRVLVPASELPRQILLAGQVVREALALPIVHDPAIPGDVDLAHRRLIINAWGGFSTYRIDRYLPGPDLYMASWPPPNASDETWEWRRS